MVFKKGSTTFYYSSLFFPKKIWQKVATLYAYVRTVDNFVDQSPAKIKAFRKIALETKHAWEGKLVTNPIVENFVNLAKKNNFSYSWVEAFLDSMHQDLDHKKYQTYKDLEKYIYGSASVIGLMMCKILGLEKNAYRAAQKQGEAMQLINFIRDLSEDCALKRQYLPEVDLKKFAVHNLCTPPRAEADKKKFASLIAFEIERYLKLQQAAEAGYFLIPFRYRLPIATAAQLYKWTALKIKQRPTIVFQKKIKPNLWQVFLTAVKMIHKWS